MGNSWLVFWHSWNCRTVLPPFCPKSIWN
jgi:hypothetical protein